MFDDPNAKDQYGYFKPALIVSLTFVSTMFIALIVLLILFNNHEDNPIISGALYNSVNNLDITSINANKNELLLHSKPQPINDAGPINLLNWQYLHCQGDRDYSRKLFSIVNSKRTSGPNNLTYNYLLLAYTLSEGDNQPVSMAFCSGINSLEFTRDPKTEKISSSQLNYISSYLNRLILKVEKQPIPSKWHANVPLYRLDQNHQDASVEFDLSNVQVGTQTCILAKYKSDEYGIPLNGTGIEATGGFEGFFLIDSAKSIVYYSGFCLSGFVGKQKDASIFNYLNYCVSVDSKTDTPLIKIDNDSILEAEFRKYRCDNTPSDSDKPDWADAIWVEGQMASINASLYAEQSTNPVILATLAAIHIADSVYTMGANVYHDLKHPENGFNPLDGDIGSPLEKYVYKSVATGGAMLAEKIGLIEKDDIEAYGTVGGKILHFAGGMVVTSAYSAATGWSSAGTMSHNAHQFWGKASHLNGLAKQAATGLGKALYYGRNFDYNAMFSLASASQDKGLRSSIDHITKIVDEHDSSVFQSSTSSAYRANSICLVVDNSGSMKDQNKLRRAKMVIDEFMIMMLDEMDDQIGLIAFTDNSKIILPLTSTGDITIAKMASRVASMAAAGGTQIDAGLNAGLEMLEKDNLCAQKAILLLTDGQDKIPDLLSFTKKFSDSFIPIYTVAYGSGADFQLLQEIAHNTGGECFRADTDSVSSIFSRIQSDIRGESILLANESWISPLSTQRFVFEVPSDSKKMTVKLKWEGSHLTLRLIDPFGRSLSHDEVRKIRFFDDPARALSYFNLLNPLPGLWKVEIFADDVPPAGEFFSIGASVNNGIRSILDFDNYHYVPGQEVQVRLTLDDGITINKAVMKYPDINGHISKRPMQSISANNGRRMKLGSRFTAPQEPGLYSVVVELAGTKADGRPFKQFLNKSLFNGSKQDVVAAINSRTTENSFIWVPVIVTLVLFIIGLTTIIAILVTPRSDHELCRSGRSVYVGSRQGCEIQKSDDVYISSIHGCFTEKQSMLFYENLSQNGSVVDGKFVFIGLHRVRMGSRIQMGKSTYVLIDENELRGYWA